MRVAYVFLKDHLQVMYNVYFDPSWHGKQIFLSAWDEGKEKSVVTVVQLPNTFSTKE